MTDHLHPRVAELVDALHTAQHDFETLLARIPAEQGDVVPGEGRWSIAQHVEHLAIVEDGAGRLIAKLIKQVQSTGALETERTTVLDSLDHVQLWTVRKRIEAPDFVKPTEGLSIAEGLARLTASRTRLIDAFQRASGLALGSAMAPHPVLGPLTIYQWGLMAAQHQRRHAESIAALVAA